MPYLDSRELSFGGQAQAPLLQTPLLYPMSCAIQVPLNHFCIEPTSQAGKHHYSTLQLSVSMQLERLSKKTTAEQNLILIL